HVLAAAAIGHEGHIGLTALVKGHLIVWPSDGGAGALLWRDGQLDCRTVETLGRRGVLHLNGGRRRRQDQRGDDRHRFRRAAIPSCLASQRAAPRQRDARREQETQRRQPCRPLHQTHVPHPSYTVFR